MAWNALASINGPISVVFSSGLPIGRAAYTFLRRGTSVSYTLSCTNRWRKVVQRCPAVPKAEGDAKLALIKRCDQPWNKKCRCDAHREYFGGWLD